MVMGNWPIADLAAGAVGGLSASSILIAIIWTRLYYIEKKLDSLINGAFQCSEHKDLHDQVLILKMKRIDGNSKL
jgi:hypothetical protein